MTSHHVCVRFRGVGSLHIQEILLDPGGSCHDVILPHPLSAFSINPVTGRVEDEQPNPMEGMTEEQKELEAMKLVKMFDKLSR